MPDLPDGTIRVLIADDHGLVRAGLRMLLASQPDMNVVAEAADGVQALSLARQLQPRVVLADISMPPPDGIELARLLTVEAPICQTLIVSMHEDRQMLEDAIAAGAAGYVIKRALQSDLITAIRTVAAGQRYVHRELEVPLPGAGEAPTSPEPVPPAGPLDDQEVQLLTMLAGGATMQRIAEALGLSREEADRRRQAVMARLGLHSRVDVIGFVRQSRLPD